ncbi:hypothetical protein BHE74_00001438 [Ensete ventricosum]|nr:hypothetical protein GW17_00005821 [Ensete ventricosum]RWW89571.1 hypothetical protein BHE74_00001438 [Ensete ventricosum]RZR76197.1 hypothetical protein BHM03_00000829 [Ensete ventricosum]
MRLRTLSKIYNTNGYLQYYGRYILLRPLFSMQTTHYRTVLPIGAVSAPEKEEEEEEKGEPGDLMLLSRSQSVAHKRFLLPARGEEASPRARKRNVSPHGLSPRARRRNVSPRGEKKRGDVGFSFIF